VDVTALLTHGENVLGATVLYYGFGDGTWPMGKPGFIFKLDIEYADGTAETIVSDRTWQTQLARSWRPGQYKRWYLRSLQEDFDARRYPYGWHAPGFETDASWVAARELSGRAHQTALSAGAADYLFDSTPTGVTQLRRRSIPMMIEKEIAVQRFAGSHWIRWKQDPMEYFDLGTSDAFEAVPGDPVSQADDTAVEVPLTNLSHGAVLTWELAEQVVGWPAFNIDAPEGTVVELMVQGGHRPHSEGGPALMNNYRDSWTRFRCRQGRNAFSTFDYESVKWIQLHVHGAQGVVKVTHPTVRRRVYDFPHQPQATTSEPRLQRLFDACVNTILNNSHETIVDCMGRERQQYSGDIGHVIHSLHHAFGEERLPARFLNTFSQGLTKEGFFLDCWPAYDRLNRLAQRQLDLTPWGPLLDHGVGFVFDAYYHYNYCGHTRDMLEVFPRLVRFYRYLRSLVREDDLLPVEELGVPTVWIDHEAYQKQRHKQCAFNLYVAAMLKDAFAPLCEAFGRPALQKEAGEFSHSLYAAARRRFFSASEGLFINNLPWHAEERQLRTCDRSLAHLVLSDFVSDIEKAAVLRELQTRPKRMGLSYPANAQWRLWALAEGGRAQTVIDELRTTWAAMDSVVRNNTLSENWQPRPDTGSEWSHASVAPLYLAYMKLAGIKPLSPGGSHVRIWPQTGNLDEFSVVYHTPRGPVKLAWAGKTGTRTLQIETPQSMTTELWLDAKEQPGLRTLDKTPRTGLKAWALDPGKVTIQLKAM
jgi:alpha-L-rhamnosidase